MEAIYAIDLNNGLSKMVQSHGLVKNICHFL